MCGTVLWSVAGFVACVYFAYASYVDLRDDNFYWQSGWWTNLTWAVWLVLAAGLLSETCCWRERTFFGLLAAIFLMGLVFSVWNSAQPTPARYAREVSLVLWSFASLASLTTLSRPKALPS
jgi:hypothetical protein